MNDAITPFTLAVPQADLEDLNRRIDQTRWPDAETVDDWTQGAPLAKVKALVDHWRAALYGVSEQTLYRALAERARPRALRRSDRGTPRVLPQDKMPRRNIVSLSPWRAPELAIVAYRLCREYAECLAVVVSQDGSVKFVANHQDKVTYWNHLDF